ncbi:MAG: glycosyltransferase family 25 protein [Comamonas sp.]
MQQNFEIRVISLVDQKDRRDKVSSILDAQPLRWRFMDAVSGKNISEYMVHYDRARRLKALGYGMKDNEIACFISHRKVWQECVEAQKPCLILEDDIKLSDSVLHAGEVVEFVNNLILDQADAVYVRLGFLRKDLNFVSVKKINSHIALVRFEKDPLTAMAYVISPQIAAKLLHASERFFTPVDDFMWRGWEHQCCLLDVFPAIFYTSDEDTPSNIGARVKPRIGLFEKMKREYYRFFDNKNKVLYEKKMLKAKRA